MNLYNYSVYDLYIFQLYRKLNGFLFSLFFFPLVSAINCILPVPQHCHKFK